MAEEDFMFCADKDQYDINEKNYEVLTSKQVLDLMETEVQKVKNVIDVSGFFK